MTSRQTRTSIPLSSSYVADDMKCSRLTPCEYVWLDSCGEVRSKIRTLTLEEKHSFQISRIPEWNYDGSSTDQAKTDCSGVRLIPIDRPYKHPFIQGIVVFCLTQGYTEDTPSFKNMMDLSEALKSQECWFTFEQEYTLLQPGTRLPMGWKDSNTPPPPQGPYYCGNGCEGAFGRDLVQDHYQVCLSIGLRLSGLNAEVMPGQWEYQVGPESPVTVCVHAILARFVLLRLAECFNYIVTLHPKPIDKWNGAGMHTNFSTKAMRESYQPILDYITAMESRHAEHMTVYGKENELRLVGQYETSNFTTFKYGVGDRSASVRIPLHVHADQKGYLEDRRPAANANPFDVVEEMLKTLQSL